MVKSLTTCDLLKAFLQIAWENKHIKDKQFVFLSEGLVEINKMLFGWRQFLEKTPE